MKRTMEKIRCGGFSLPELLVTLAVIGVLLALLVPALNQVSKTATKVKQKAQFHAIGTALEAFRNDYGDYPPSEWDAAVYGDYSASQRLAEALVGRDGFGFHPNSKFLQNGTDGTIAVPGNELYYPNFVPFDNAERDANLAARKGPYLELENANAVTLQNLYGVGNHNPLTNTFVLADMYKITKNAATGKETGMPILYYRANGLKVDHDPSSPDTSTYNVQDSTNGIVALNPPSGGAHPLLGNLSLFYNKTQNPNFTAPPRPYRAESFLLHSAGPDGLYGTTDDIFNFDQD